MLPVASIIVDPVVAYNGWTVTGAGFIASGPLDSLEHAFKFPLTAYV